MAGNSLWTYRRPFRIDGLEFVVTLRSRTDGLTSELSMLGVPVVEDRTPLGGPDAVRNHRLAAVLPDGRRVEVEAGWISSLNTGIAVRLDGRLVHESHPGRVIAYPEKYRATAEAMGDRSAGQSIKAAWKEGWNEAKADGYDIGVWKRNRWAIGVDLALGLLFFVVAKFTDLSTAALVGAGAGILLLVVQRFVKVDLIGGLALFGIVMLLISAGLAIAFQDDDAVKWRGTLVGLIGAALFLGDGLLGGKKLGKGLARYLPYTDIVPARLSIGMGLLSAAMAALNLLVARLASTDTWLFYKTFLDSIVAIMLILIVMRYARGQLFGGVARPAAEGGEAR